MNCVAPRYKNSLLNFELSEWHLYKTTSVVDFQGYCFRKWTDSLQNEGEEQWKGLREGEGEGEEVLGEGQVKGEGGIQGGREEEEEG